MPEAIEIQLKKGALELCVLALLSQHDSYAYEIASQLSFTLLGNIPDAPLTAAAADGSLATTAGLDDQIHRLLGLPAAQAYLTDVLTRIVNGHPNRDIDQLLPWAYRAQALKAVA